MSEVAPASQFPKPGALSCLRGPLCWGSLPTLQVSEPINSPNKAFLLNAFNPVRDLEMGGRKDPDERMVPPLLRSQLSSRAALGKHPRKLPREPHSLQLLPANFLLKARRQAPSAPLLQVGPNTYQY